MPHDASTLRDIVTSGIEDVLGLKNLTEEEQDGLISEMLQIIQNRALARIADVCTEEEHTILADAFEKNNVDAVDMLLVQKGLPDLPSLIGEETLLFKVELGNLVKEEKV
ncbi:MAG: hypothetical protein Q7R79_01435 [bacterium]|nr:hypothetical protein [bacterium]